MEWCALPIETTPVMELASFEQDVLESYLLEIDATDFPVATPRGPSTPVLKRATADVAAASSSRPVKKKAMLTWKRRKEEQYKLREEAEALQSRLRVQKLRTAHRAMLRALGSERLSAEQRQLRDAAESEKQKCQAAREENARLKDQLERYSKATRNLRKAVAQAGLKQRDLVMTNPFAARVLRAELRNAHLLQPRSAVFIDLENRLKVQNSKLESLLRLARKSMFGPDNDQITVHREGVDRGLAEVEIKRSRFLPFDAHKTSGAAWKVMQGGLTPDDQNTSVSTPSDDTVMSQGCTMAVIQDGGTVEVRVIAMISRVAVPDGFVVLTESTSEWRVRPAQAKAWTITTQESDCALVLANDSRRAGTCQVQLSARVRAHGPSSEQDAHTLFTPVVSDVVVPSFREVLSSRYQLLENTLLDGSS